MEPPAMDDPVTRHYERLLAKSYSWMFGQSLAEKVAEQRALLGELGIGPALTGPAVDLGCGPGYQAFALAELGARPVLAVDTSPALLDELQANLAGRPVQARLADIRSLAALAAAGSVETVTCMGDTLPHLASREEVRALFADAHGALQPGGALALTWRDLSQPLEGLDRILPIRADDGRIMTCLLDFAAESVTVTDIIHQREDGGWRMDKSSYRKLRLPAEWVAAELQALGFRIAYNAPAGRLHALVARKP